MSHIFRINGYDEKDCLLNGNRFLLANGHIGYRGTLLEDRKSKMPGLVLSGVYDQHQDDWRENILFPNPLHMMVLHQKKPIHHELSLDLEKATLYRRSEYDAYDLSSVRFVSHADDSLLGEKISIQAKEDCELALCFGMDREIADLHGPHFKEMKFIHKGKEIAFDGLTNEGLHLYEKASYALSKGNAERLDVTSSFATISLKAGESVSLTILAKVSEESIPELPDLPFEGLLLASQNAFFKKWKAAEVHIEGDDELDNDLAFSMYHLLILGDGKRCRSIAARGLSGQTYKGAIFWDTEIFLLPAFILFHPQFARNLLLYRIQTLSGALKKAASYGFKGAFYAWESQDGGKEACRSDNVIDPVTKKPIRTYFAEKQIHISADIVYAIDQYIRWTGDESILDEGGREVIYQCALFYASRSKLLSDGLYHLLDVIGPDEYHEGVDDNAFTSYLAHHCMDLSSQYCPQFDLSLIQEVLERFYLPKMDERGLLEQFKGYFSLEDCSVSTLEARLRNPKDYWGGPNGVATKTQIIKQADVVALMVLLGDRFNQESKEANYQYYLKRTEHGSSLSASMHAILGARLGDLESAYALMKKSAHLDIIGGDKLFAGGVYIGGTHPAANAGAYLSLIYGLIGLHKENGTICLDPKLPKPIQSVTFHIQGGTYKVYQDGSYEFQKEAKDD